MPKKNNAIPVNIMAGHYGAGISIEKIDLSTLDKATLNTFEEGKEAHRHDSHSFFLVENGTVQLELDFQHYVIIPPSVIYIHPDQVHHTSVSENVVVSCLSMTNESLNPEYLKLLQGITPAKPIILKAETFSIISEAVSLCIKFSERINDKLYHSLLKDSCNALAALVVSQYLALTKPTEKLSRFETVTKAFKETLEQHYTTAKRPADYARELNISTPYLNECVKNATGHSVSHHIQQRVILEAKRLLYHSERSVKEIATILGYDDYPYFSRLFTKITGMTALAFRSKNHD